jgi:hypothetical protein
VIVEITMEACEPGVLMESSVPSTVWLKPLLSGGNCNEVAIRGQPEEIVPFLVNGWGLSEGEAWDVIVSQADPTRRPVCTHCGLPVEGRVVADADGAPMHELCRRKEERESQNRALALLPPPEGQLLEVVESGPTTIEITVKISP